MAKLQSSKKILCISVMEHWGGGEEFLLKLIRSISEYEFVIASPAGEPFNVFQQAKIKIFKVNSLKKLYRNAEGWTFLMRLKIIANSIVSSIKLIKVILSQRIDLVLANGNFAGMYGLPPAILTRRKFIIVQHLIYDAGSVESKILKILNRHAGKLVCISESVFENVNNILEDKKQNKIAVIHHGINLPELNKIENESKTGNGGNINIGIVGSIIRLKAIDVVIDAVKEIIFLNKNIYLKIFGSARLDETDSVKYEMELKKMVTEENISSNILFIGFEKAKENIYPGLDIVINYSIVPESFSFTVLEAMSFGKIVIASDLGGPTELIINEKNGFLIPPHNIKALKEKIEFCIDNLNSQMLKNMRADARRTADEKYSMEKFSSEYKKLFDSILLS